MSAPGKCKGCGAEVLFNTTVKGSAWLFQPEYRWGGRGFEFTPDGAAFREDAPKTTRIYVSHWAVCGANPAVRQPIQ